MIPDFERWQVEGEMIGGSAIEVGSKIELERCFRTGAPRVRVVAPAFTVSPPRHMGSSEEGFEPPRSRQVVTTSLSLSLAPSREFFGRPVPAEQFFLAWFRAFGVSRLEEKSQISAKT